MMNEARWFAVYTRPRWEKKVSELLTKRRISNYCPLNKIQRQWSDRRKLVYEPLFTSYVFVHLNDKELMSILPAPGVINFVYWLGKPVVINDTEIENIRHFTSQHYNIKLEKAGVNVDGNVKIISEPNLDVNNNIITVKNSNFRMLLPSLGYVMTAEIAKSTADVFNYGFGSGKMVS